MNIPSSTLERLLSEYRPDQYRQVQTVLYEYILVLHIEIDTPRCCHVLPTTCSALAPPPATAGPLWTDSRSPLSSGADLHPARLSNAPPSASLNVCTNNVISDMDMETNTPLLLHDALSIFIIIVYLAKAMFSSRCFQIRVVLYSVYMI